MDWMNPTEAARYFGIETEDELEDIVSDFGLDVEVDDDGHILRVEATFDTRAALFALHELRVGYNPADETMQARIEEEEQKKQAKEKEARSERRKLLTNRMKGRARRVAPPKLLDPPKPVHNPKYPYFWHVEEVEDEG